MPISHIESSYFERAQRSIESPAAAFREDVNPLVVVAQLGYSLIERFESAALFGDGYSPNGFHDKTIFASERLGIHGDPCLPETHRLHDANHIPTVNMVAHRHHAMLKKLSVSVYFLTTFDFEAISDSVQKEGKCPSYKIDDRIHYFEPQRFVKIGVGPVKTNVLELPAYRSHLREGIVGRKLLNGLRDINILPHFEVSVCRTK
jgi:hypothetical protein